MKAPEIVELSPLTARVMRKLQQVRKPEPFDPVDARALNLDHARLNVLLRKGLVENVGRGQWRLTPRGRACKVHESNS